MPRTKPEVEERPVGWTETIERFAEHLEEQERSSNTIRCYRHDLVMFDAWYQEMVGDEPELATIDASDLRDWKSHMTSTDHAPQTVNRRMATLQSILKWAQSREWCQPVQMPRAVRQQPPRPRWLTRPEEHALLRAVKAGGDPRDICLVTFLLHTGARIAEAAGIKWNDIEIAERSGKVELLGKGWKRRPVRLDSEVRAALTAWAGWDLKVSTRLGTDRNVFGGQRGPMRPKSLGQVVAQYGPRAKLFDLTAHHLRHTCCRRWIESGLDLVDVAALAGHESLETTRRYVTPGQSELQALVERRCGGEVGLEPKPARPRRRGR